MVISLVSGGNRGAAPEALPGNGRRGDDTKATQ
jgi:hypothetical protein